MNFIQINKIKLKGEKSHLGKACPHEHFGGGGEAVGLGRGGVQGPPFLAPGGHGGGAVRLR